MSLDEYADETDRRTDARPLHYALRDGCGQRNTATVNRQLLAVPRYRLNTYGRRAFSVAGPTVCNSLPNFSPGFHPGPDHQCRLFQTFA